MSRWLALLKHTLSVFANFNITSSLRGLALGFLCAHVEGTVLSMTCLVNASKEIGQSAPVLFVWMHEQLCVLRFSVIFALIDLPAKTSLHAWLSRCLVACRALVHLPQGERSFSIQLSLRCTCSLATAREQLCLVR